MRIFIITLLLLSSLVAKEERIVLGAGCFWGVENYFSKLQGVNAVRVGYAGGDDPHPTYKKVLKARYQTEGAKNHTEVVEVLYDTTRISTHQLLQHFWELHDPTQGNRQGADRGTNYRSAIYYTTQEQYKEALQTKNRFQKALDKAGFGTITTEVAPLKHFYVAEPYHQKYLQKHPYGYCPNHQTGVRFEKEKKPTSPKVITPLGGKEIIVIESKGCPFCQKLNKEVLQSYHGKIPLRRAKKEELVDFQLQTPLNVTPLILFIENGKEVASYKGYLPPYAFYQKVGAFLLGEESEAYRVAFASQTDGRFCQKYQKFQHVKDGVFIDRISQEPLFDTRDRFNSGSGWLSFTRAIEGAVILKKDTRFGLQRVEVLAKKSGAHLGHRFNDGPEGKPRFCINATVLEFVPRHHYPHPSMLKYVTIPKKKTD